jgi:hypothetical protein
MSSLLFTLRDRNAIIADYVKLIHGNLVVSEGKIYVPYFIIICEMT